MTATTGQTTFGERLALVNVYSGMGGSTWSTATNWAVGDPCQNAWFGVGCNVTLFPNTVTYVG